MSDETVVLEVHITQDEFGRVSSIHEFRSPEDEKRSRQWKNGGVRQIAHALLTETARREAYVCALVRLTQEPEFLDAYVQGTEADRTKAEQQLAQALQVVVHRTLGKMGPDIAKEVLEMMVQSAKMSD